MLTFLLNHRHHQYVLMIVVEDCMYDQKPHESYVLLFLGNACLHIHFSILCSCRLWQP